MRSLSEATGLAASFLDAVTEEVTISDEIGAKTIEIAEGTGCKDKFFRTKSLAFHSFVERFFKDFERGPKDGRCILQGSLVAPERIANNVKANYILMLDHDSGETLDEIKVKIATAGLYAIVWHTHSHGATETEIAQDELDHWIKNGELKGDDLVAAAASYLRAKKGVVAPILESIADVALEHRAGGVKYVVRHDPMPKCRSLFILDEPFAFAVEGVSQKKRLDEWKLRYKGFAHALGVIVDEKTCDASRLMYTPRIAKSADREAFEICMIPGRAVRLDDMPPASVEERPARRKAAPKAQHRVQVVPADVADTFRTPGMKQFLATTGKTFKAAEWLATVAEVRADKGDGKMEFACPLDEMHSNAGDPADRAFFATNSDPDGDRPWTMYCCHATCSAHTENDRAHYLDAACVKYGIEHASALDVWCQEPGAADGEPNWTRDPKGRILKNDSGNLARALEAMKVSVWFDDFLFAEMISGLGKDYDGEQTDAAIGHLRYLIERTYDFLPHKDAFYDWLAWRTWQIRRNVAREHFEDLPAWDGTPRLDTWLIKYCGAEDTPINRMFGRVWLLGAMTRAMSPGCKFDYMLILEGEQGVGKSTTVRTLCPFEDWFTDSIDMLADSKVMMELCRGKLLVECAEMAGMRKADVDHVKANVTRQTDEGRLAYARKKTIWKRTCAFVGTTNALHYLKDDTGNRRFFPVRVTKADLDTLRLDRGQLWAEALAAYKRGETPILPPEFHEAATEAQAQRVADDPIYERLLPWVAARAGWILKKDVYEMLALDCQNNAASQRVGAAMRRLGFEAAKHRVDAEGRGDKRPTALFVRAPTDWTHVSALTYTDQAGEKRELPRIECKHGPEYSGIALQPDGRVADGVEFNEGTIIITDPRTQADKDFDTALNDVGTRH